MKDILRPFHNIRDFEFLFALFDHSSFSKKKLELLFIFFDLFYYPKYFKYNFSFFIFTQIF